MKNFNIIIRKKRSSFRFAESPKQLFTDREYADLSAESKVLYGLLLDRMGLSIKNRWYDEQKRVYIYFTLEEAAQLLGCGRDKAMRLFKELDNRLIHRGNRDVENRRGFMWEILQEKTALKKQRGKN